MKLNCENQQVRSDAVNGAAAFLEHALFAWVQVRTTCQLGLSTSRPANCTVFFFFHWNSNQLSISCLRLLTSRSNLVPATHNSMFYSIYNEQIMPVPSLSRSLACSHTYKGEISALSTLKSSSPTLFFRLIFLSLIYLLLLIQYDKYNDGKNLLNSYMLCICKRNFFKLLLDHM